MSRTPFSGKVMGSNGSTMAMPPLFFLKTYPINKPV
jgi:hypothetical protein